MKKLFLIVAALFVAVSFSACSDDDDKDVSIIGTWQHTREMGFEDDNGEEYEFDKMCSDEYCCLIFDDSGTGRETYDGGSDKITYTINGKTLKNIFPISRNCCRLNIFCIFTKKVYDEPY